MSLFTRARRHVDMNRVKEMREEKIKEETIAEVQKQQEDILAELKKIEIKESPKYSNWRRELKDLSEQMTTVDIVTSVLPADPDTIRSPLPDTSLSSANNYLGEPDENGVVFRKVEFEPIDATKVDTLTITISGSFGTKTVDGFELTDKVDIAQYVNGTYVGSFLAQELGNGTHTLTIPQRFRKANSKFEALQPTAFEGGGGHQTGSVSITGIGFKRLNAMPAVVRLDDPEINSFIRDGQTDKLSPADKKKKLEDQLKAGSDYLDKMFGKDVMPKGATTIADYEPQQSFMDIQVGDERITKVNNKTVTDTTRKIKDGKMDGKPIYYDNQGNMRVSEPKPQPKPQPKSTTTTTSDTDKTPSWSITDAPKTTTTKYVTTIPQQKEIQNTVKNDPKVANAVEKLGTAGKTYLDYLTNNLPDVIDNNYLGKEYVNSIFKDAKINQLGTVSVGDNIVGTGGKPTYDPKTKTVSIPFNYDFKTNDQEFSDPSKAGKVNDFQKAVLNAVGPYSADAQLNTPILPLNSLAGIVLGGAIGVSKALGGGQAKKGNLTMNADKLKKINPTLHKQLVKEEVLTEKKKLKSPEEVLKKIPGYYDGKPSPLGFPVEDPPKMVNGYHPDLVDGKKVANRFNRLDPISARAMPKTGNPHIDKKVRAAAKKPK